MSGTDPLGLRGIMDGLDRLARIGQERDRYRAALEQIRDFHEMAIAELDDGWGAAASLAQFAQDALEDK